MYTKYFIISLTLSFVQHFNCVRVIFSISIVLPASGYSCDSYMIVGHYFKEAHIPDSLRLSSDGSFSLVFVLPCLMTAGTTVLVNVDTCEAISVLASSSHCILCP